MPPVGEDVHGDSSNSIPNRFLGGGHGTLRIRYGGGCAYDRSGGEGCYGGEVRQSGPVAGKLTMKEASGRDSSPGAELGS